MGFPFEGTMMNTYLKQGIAPPCNSGCDVFLLGRQPRVAFHDTHPLLEDFELGAEVELLHISMHGKGRVYQSEWFAAAVCSMVASIISKPAPKPVVNRQQACKRVHLRSFWHQNDTIN